MTREMFPGDKEAPGSSFSSVFDDLLRQWGLMRDTCLAAQTLVEHIADHGGTPLAEDLAYLEYTLSKLRSEDRPIHGR